MEFPRGSEWRKWDLHVHAPGAKLRDDYAKVGGKPDWEQFCRVLHDSDVFAFGITDYFSLDSYFDFKEKYLEFYPDDSKIFFPNLELRLPESLNDAGQSVNVHIIFRPELTKEDANKFLSTLLTESTTGASKKPVSCRDLSSVSDCERATVSRKSIDTALATMFGAGQPMEEFALVLASAKGDGIRPGGKGSKKRKNQLVDEIDKQCNAFFAGPNSAEHFLNEDRLESSDKVPAKPVFDGCDAHNFKELTTRLGRHNVSSDPHFHTTWIKADLTYEGLLQTLVEPKHRVAIQANEPDTKQPYQYISSIGFSDTGDFPDEIFFNRNLNSIIGSRSSGKSALLAMIAHAVDPEYTIQQQMDASGDAKNEVGPAAGKTWSDVGTVGREVKWGAEDATSGKVIYIPQNSLYLLSRQPDKVNEKIEPALFRLYPDFEATYDKAKRDVQAANSRARSAVLEWFSTARQAEALTDEIKALGDKKAIATTQVDLLNKMTEVKGRSELTEDELTTYQEVSLNIESRRARLTELEVEYRTLSQYALVDDGVAASVPDAIQVSINVLPSAASMPEALGETFLEAIDETRDSLTERLEEATRTALSSVVVERQRLTEEMNALTTDNAPLLAKHAANTELEAVTKDYEKQSALLSQIGKKEELLSKAVKAQDEEAVKTSRAIKDRDAVLADLKSKFDSAPMTLEGLTFGVEIDLEEDSVSARSSAFNRNKVSVYIDHKGGDFGVRKAQQDPKAFLEALRSKAQELNKGFSPESVALDTLLLTEEVRFTAELDSDVIGGFGTSTMTPGKQALFALTLILNESQEPWPLLIDQPEDDLDSRSIYDSIVPYLIERKQERQIIMVSHNPNLVVGADSEEVIVANRDGRDMPNKGRRTFEYLSGSLEHTQSMNAKSSTALGRCGIREHACIILDGGKEAFQKRREKYNIKV